MRGKYPKAKPTGEVSIPPCPRTLDKLAKKEWRRVIQRLAELNLLSRLDMSTVAVYATAFSRWTQAEQHLAAEGVIVKSPNGHDVQSAWLAVSNRMVIIMERACTQLGMTPTARTRLTIEPPTEADEARQQVADYLRRSAEFA
jgi:P27 family predicted phage terminase small subunit